MSDHALPFALAVLIAVLFIGGAAFVLWRTVVALRSGLVWLHGQKVARADEPVWFWAYVTTYLLIIVSLLYGVRQAVLL